MNTLEKLRDLADQDQHLAEELLGSGAFPNDLFGELMDCAAGDDILLLVGLARNPHLHSYEVRSLVETAQRVTQESGGKTGDTFPLIDFVLRELVDNPATPLNLLIEARTAFDSSIRLWMDSVISHPSLPLKVYQRLVQGFIEDSAPAPTGDLGTIFTDEDLESYFAPREGVSISLEPVLKSQHFFTLDEDVQFNLLATTSGGDDNWTLRWLNLPEEVAPSVLANLYEMLLRESHPYFNHALGQLVNHPRFPEDALHPEDLEVDVVDGELCTSDRSVQILMSSRSQSNEVMDKVMTLVSLARGNQFFDVLNHGFGFDGARVNGTPRTEEMLLKVLDRLESDPKLKRNFAQIAPLLMTVLTNPGVTSAVVDQVARMVPEFCFSVEENPYFDYITIGSVVMHPQLSEKMRDALLRPGSTTLAEMAHFQDFGALPQSPQVARQVLSAQVHGVPSQEEFGGGSRGRHEAIHQEAMIGMQWLGLLWKHADEVIDGPDSEEWFDLVTSVALLMLADGVEDHDWRRLAILLGVMDRDGSTVSFSQE